MIDQPVTIAVVREEGRYKATAGAHVAFGDYATIAAREAAALHFHRTKEEINVEPKSAVLVATVRKAGT